MPKRYVKTSLLACLVVALPGCVIHDPKATRQGWDAVFAFTEDMQQARKDDTVVAQLSYDAVGFPPMTGVTVGTYRSPDLVLEGTYSYGTKRLDENDNVPLPSGYDAYVEAAQTRIHLKHFFTNVIYHDLGMMIREADVRTLGEPLWKGASRRRNPDKLAHVQYQTFGVTASIGSRYQWSNTVVGLDWLGFYYPVGKKLRSNILKDVPDDEMQVYEDAEKTERTGVPWLWTLSLGWSI